MLTQFLSAPPTPGSLYLCFALVLVLSGLAVIPLQPASGAGESVETSVRTSAERPNASNHEARERYEDRDFRQWLPSTMQPFAGDTKLALLAFLSENDRSSVSHSATALRTTTAPSFHSYSAPPFIPPTISLTSPTNNATFIAGSTITLGATASDSDGTVSKVEFFQGAVKLGEVTTLPYSYDWTNVAAGDYVLTARATDNAGEITTSAAINFSVLAQVKQYVGWSSISNGIDLGNGCVRKTSTGAWDFSANSLQTLLPGDGYFESTASMYNQSINLVGSDGASRAFIIGGGGWAGIYENGQEVAATYGYGPSQTISNHVAGDRYRIEITNGTLRYVRYRSGSREVMFTSASVLPAYPISVALGISPQNAEWQKTVLAQLTRKVTWSSIANGMDLGNGSVRKTSTGAWDFSANSMQTLLQGDGYFESTASMYNQSINLAGSDGASRALIIGGGGWAGIYENGVEVAGTCCHIPSEIIPIHAAGDRYRLEIGGGKLRYVKYRSGVRTIMFTSAASLPTYPLGFSLGASPQNAEWQNTVIAQLAQNVSWSSIQNGIDLGNGSVRKTSTGAWDFYAGARQQLVHGSGYFESTASSYNQSINLAGSDGASRALIIGGGGWAGIYENGVEVAGTCCHIPSEIIPIHAAGDRYRLEIGGGKLRYVKYRSGVRTIMFTSAASLPTYPLEFSLGASPQNAEWQNSMFSDNMPEHNDASFVSQTVPTTMVPGQTYSVSVTMRNTGTSTWTPDSDYQLASENLSDNQRWGLNRVNLTSTVLPGSDATFNFTVTAPATGLHSFQWRMVQQDVERFGSLSTNVNVQTVNGAPTVSLTGPANNATFTAPATVALTATASDSDGTVSKVEFFQGSTKLGEDTTAPYTYNWTNVTVGSYVLTARATDNGGATATSAAVNITVNAPNQPPSVSLSAPANNAIFAVPANITLTATANDTDGIVTKVQFFQGTTLLGEDLSGPFSFTWNNVAAGSYSLTAKATDNVGAIVTSAAVSIIVNTPPTVSITSPTSGTVFTSPASFTITASAADADGISKVEFFAGVGLLGEDTTAPYSFTWSNLSHGTYWLTAKATDNRGTVTTSAAVSGVVTNAPTSSITSPANNATYASGSNIVIAALASDTDGTVAKVEFFRGGVLLSEDTMDPYNFVWNGVPSGTYSLTARATDDLGVTTLSEPVNITVVNFTMPRLDPMNRTGGADENPLSRNFNWSVPLVGLPGRAGLDLGLSLSYNSLVWTSNGSSISFNDDGGFPSPGFRLGFPVIQSRYFNSLVGKYAFMLLTPNGERVELRQVNATSTYEAGDSSYLTLVVNADNTITVRTTDGTQLSYEWKVSDYECTKIKDRNGNFISINYVSGSGRIDTVVDTLSRTIKFNYDTGGYLSSIKQIWNQGTANEQNHEWASFIYNPALPIQTNFSGVTNVGPQNGSTLKVLTSVKLNDSSLFYFDYTSWGQVWKISNYAADGDLLNYRAYNLPGSQLLATGPQNDCPRFTERHDWAESWNGDADGTPATLEEAVTLFAQPVNASLPDGSLQTVTRAQVTSPDGTYHQIYFAGTIEGTAGSAPAWQRGLPLVTDTFGRADANSPIIKQRSSATAWTQSDTNVSHSLNPRVAETNVYDFNGSGLMQNHKRTSVTYQNVSFANGTSCSLPQDVFEYQANATTVLRRTHTDYNLATTYTDRRIIGLVSEKRLYGVDPNTQTETLMSKVGFFYDENSIQGTDAPVQHDNSLLTGRANLTSIKRYDVSPGSTALVSSSVFYDTSGSIVKTIDPANHQTLLSYADQFSANGTTLDAARPATFAYPTMVTDPDNYTSSIRYHYDFGAVTWKQTPQPNTVNNLPGPEQTFAYDSVGRIQRVTNLVNGAYTRYVYPNSQPGSQNRLDTYATLIDGASEQNGNEAHSFTITDGHGRVIANASSHPGSLGGFSGQIVVYDNLGRAIKTSNPTETSASGAPSQWAALGDDATAGWLYTFQTYDWKGRPLVTTNTDLSTKGASYNGCGCAGGQVVTITDEGTLDSGVLKRRQQKIYADVLGRTVKTEVFNWQGGEAYSTTVNTFNARDQVTLARQYQGADTSSVYQDTLMSYDGYGRLKTRHSPDQQVDSNNSASSDHTTWDYNDDDTIQKITDARAVRASFTYNSRRLIMSVNYALLSGVPSTGTSGVAPSAPVSFSYDAAGNRTSMSDGLGSVSYQYDQLSRMTSETRTFADPANSSLNGITRTLSYEYNLAGELKKITDPTNMTVDYNYDRVGRLGSVTAENNLYNGVSQYASAFTYRAWGAIKGLTYGNNLTLAVNYNSRLLGTQFEIAGRPAQYGQSTVMKTQFDYYSDGNLKYAHDLLDERFDRAVSYDQVSMPKEAYSGSEARDYVTGTSSGAQTGPYRQSYQHDAFGNITNRITRFWSQDNTFTATYINNRRQDAGFHYDAAGNLTEDPNLQYGYDASGRNSSIFSVADGRTVSSVYDGDAQVVKRNELQAGTSTITYYLRSTVLGGKVIIELDGQAQKRKGFVFAGERLLAEQSGNVVTWRHENPLTGSRGGSETNGFYHGDIEPDPLGVDVGFSDPFNLPPLEGPFEPNVPILLSSDGGCGFNPNCTTCLLDGFTIDCEQAGHLLEIGAAEFAPPTTVWANGQWNFVHFDPNTGQYIARVFAGYDYTSVTVNGSTSGAWHPHFDTVVVQPAATFDLWNLHFDTQHFGPPPTGPTPTLTHADPGTIKKALYDCIQELWGNLVQLTNLDPSQKGKGGSASFTVFDGSGGIKEFATVHNNVTSFTASGLGFLFSQTTSSGLYRGPIKRDLGLTVPGTYNLVLEGEKLIFSPYENYTASNRSKYHSYYSVLEGVIGKYLDTQIHELGNSIAVISRKYVGNPNDAFDKDSGHRLEGCVAGKLSGGN